MVSRGAVLALLVALAASSAHAGRDVSVTKTQEAPLGSTMNADGTVSNATPVAVLPSASAAALFPADEPLPALAAGVTERKRCFSVGLDPEAEQTAAEWFQSLGYRVLTGDQHYTKGFWGGTVVAKDARMAVSYCTSTSDVSLLEGYDFANWLPIPSVYDSLVLDFPDAKFILFETPVDQWFVRIQAKVLEAQLMGETCGCVGVVAARSLDPMCGDLTHHYCDVYPCLYERVFASYVVDPLAWKEAYINHVAKVKTSIPSERLLVVPMLGPATNPVLVAKAIGTFLGISPAPAEFAALHPFEPHMLQYASQHRWSIVLFVLVGVAGLALLFMPNPWAGGLGGYHEYQH